MKETLQNIEKLLTKAIQLMERRDPFFQAQPDRTQWPQPEPPAPEFERVHVNDYPPPSE
jgi:hypothetical protein